MGMNMFLHELKSYRKSTIIWTCSLIALAFLYLSIFPSISQSDSFEKFIESLSEDKRRAIGIAIESITSLLGFYSFIFVYVVLCGAIQAMNLGTSIMSKEVRDKTADFLMTKPVSRVEILSAKLLAGLTLLVATNIIYIAAAGFLVSIVKDKPFSMKVFVMISVTLFFLQLIFMSLGIIISVIFPNIKSVISISLSTVLGFFFISVVGSVIGEKAIRYVTPFKFFDSTYIIKNAAFETSFIIEGVVFIAAAITASYLIYWKKDIHAV